ncbi:PilZ domain-containing protein [Histidinibacterium lentulum]|uniref:PilZ domain-containing protein n=1 Tax=Histidinibacterium lentulum TaxID=2480588 RepID=A0A3N2QTE7_9RHOB|nr:PilZ domain-containing protein [Histidinibacterium lentulum]ROT98496.1 PilZ domain-containing protein [Histidinibacterium lentulum]
MARGYDAGNPPAGTGTPDPVRRLHVRAPLDALGELTRDHDLLIAVVTDLSAGGARLRLHDAASSRFFGEGWTISSPIFGRLPVDIRWRRLDEAGVSFPIPRDRRIALDRLVRALLRHGAGLSADGAPLRYFASGR